MTGRGLRGLSLAIGVGLASPAGSLDLREAVAYLSSDQLGGRLTGSPGEELAADYLVERLEALGAAPLDGQSGLRVPFEFTAGVRDAGSELVAGADTWGTGEVRSLSFSDEGTVEGDVVFAGYGLKIPEGRDFSYDSYFGLDVRDKIVVVLRYYPQDADDDTRLLLARYAGLRYKALHARELGAKGVVVVTGPRSERAGELVPMTFDTATSGSGIVAASITGEVAQRLFAAAGKNLEESQAALDTANPHATGFVLDGVSARLTAAVHRETSTAHNVVGVLRAPASDGGQALLLGAHYDHLGEGRHGNSLARKDEVGRIHHGADDNASGVVGVLAAAEKLAATERDRDLILAFWSGEELGLLGSAAFVADTIGDASRLEACLNLDMIGRSRDNRVVVQGVGSSDGWRRMIEQANVPVGFDLQLQDDPYLPTDSSSFNRVGVPCLNLFTGAHEDYHRPTDVADKINYADMQRVIDLTTNIGRRVMAREERLAFVKVEPRVQQGAAPAAVRAYTGTIPDYATELEGLLLSGVIGGGPAEKAGLREGDVIVKFGSLDITNIYDYTYALEAVKVGEPLTVVFRRDGEEHETVLTPTHRP